MFRYLMLGGVSWRSLATFEAPNDPPPAPPTPPTPPAPPAPPAPGPVTTGFSPEYVKDLREENKGWRLKATEQEQRAKAAEEAAAKAKADADAALAAEKAKLEADRAEAQRKADARVINAELKAAAVKAGMIDLDGLKLADISAVKLNDAGDVEGADAVLAALKEAKPYLFGEPSRGTSNTQNPAPKPPVKTGKPALEMSEEEWAQKLRAIDSGQKVV